jgi:hypothetical protein
MVGEKATRRGPSEGEHLIIQCAADGCKNREIADSLGTTEHGENLFALDLGQAGIVEPSRGRCGMKRGSHEQVYHT